METLLARTFWTDGSGQKTSIKGVLETGWGVIEAKWTTTETGEKDIEIKETWMGRSKRLEGVPRCEARAILKCLQVAKEGEKYKYILTLKLQYNN